MSKIVTITISEVRRIAVSNAYTNIIANLAKTLLVACFASNHEVKP